MSLKTCTKHDYVVVYEEKNYESCPACTQIGMVDALLIKCKAQKQEIESLKSKNG